MIFWLKNQVTLELIPLISSPTQFWPSCADNSQLDVSVVSIATVTWVVTHFFSLTSALRDDSINDCYGRLKTRTHGVTKLQRVQPWSLYHFTLKLLACFRRHVSWESGGNKLCEKKDEGLLDRGFKNSLPFFTRQFSHPPLLPSTPPRRNWKRLWNFVFLFAVNDLSTLCAQLSTELQNKYLILTWNFHHSIPNCLLIKIWRSLYRVLIFLRFLLTIKLKDTFDFWSIKSITLIQVLFLGFLECEISSTHHTINQLRAKEKTDPDLMRYKTEPTFSFVFTKQNDISYLFCKLMQKVPNIFVFFHSPFFAPPPP